MQNMVEVSGNSKAEPPLNSQSTVNTRPAAYPAPTFAATLYGPSGPLPIDTISADELAAWQAAGWGVYISNADYSAKVMSAYSKTLGAA